MEEVDAQLVGPPISVGGTATAAMTEGALYLGGDASHLRVLSGVDRLRADGYSRQ
jgi:hypothetical protein